MPRIPNPISPLSQAFDNITRVILSMPTAEERDMQASRAQLAKSQAEKAGIDAQLGRKRLDAIGALGDAFGRAFGPIPTTELPRPSPDFEGPMPAAPTISRDQHLQNVMPDLVRAAVAANPEGLNQLGSLFRAFTANAPGSSDAIVSRAMMGAGDSAASTPTGFSQKMAQDDRQHRASLGNQFAIARMASDRAAATQEAIAARQLQAQEAALGKDFVTVVGADGKPRYMPKSEYLAIDAPARPQAVNLTQPSVTPRNYRTPDGKLGMTVDGLTDRQTGAPIPAGSVAVTVGTQDTLEGLTKNQSFDMAGHENALATFQNTLDTLQQLGADPTNIGAAGNVRSIMQNALQSADALAGVFGADPGILRDTLARFGQETGFRDTIPRLSTMADLAAYQAADALAKQSGRGLSNDDVKRFRRMLGDPTSWGANQAEFFARLNQMGEQAKFEIGQARQLRQRMSPTRAPTPQTGTAVGGADPLGIR